MFWKNAKKVPLEVRLIYVLIYIDMYTPLLRRLFQIILTFNGDLKPQKWGHSQRCEWERAGVYSGALIGLINFLELLHDFRSTNFDWKP